MASPDLIINGSPFLTSRKIHSAKGNFSQQADIGLAPLLMSKFNAARGGVKFYDFVRMGAAGIYSNVSS
ncbi:hypothetical protein ACSLOP_30130, partial [Escherichia coli]